MRLKIPKVDLRGGHQIGGRAVIDEDTGNTVGQLFFGVGIREISLFDGKYEGSFATHEECVAFAKEGRGGVESHGFEAAASIAAAHVDIAGEGRAPVGDRRPGLVELEPAFQPACRSP